MTVQWWSFLLECEIWTVAATAWETRDTVNAVAAIRDDADLVQLVAT